METLFKEGLLDYAHIPDTLVDADRNLRPMVLRMVPSICDVTSVTVAGGKIRTRHSTQDIHNFNQQHALGKTVMSMDDCGDLVFINLEKNSVGNIANGLGYRESLKFALTRSTSLEVGFSGGFVTGYEYKLVPMAGLDLRLNLIETSFGRNNITLGIEASLMPYVASRELANGKREMRGGWLTTSPYLSLKFSERAVDTKPSATHNNSFHENAAMKAARRKSFYDLGKI